MSKNYDLIVVGGGAAGFFTAINAVELNPNLQVAILEKTSKLLSKVRISGGGRCNVTNARSSPSELTKFYPRGNKKLYPIFKQFGTLEMVDWLESHGVKVKAEADQRMFPMTDSSQTIIDCFLRLVNKYKIQIINQVAVQSVSPVSSGWKVQSKQEIFYTKKLVIATGSSASFWKILQNIGLEVANPVPSLFTFNIKDPKIKELAGIALQDVTIKIVGTKLVETGPLLITHWGLSGPAILKLSARGALHLHQCDYHFKIMINMTNKSYDEVTDTFSQLRTEAPKKQIHNFPLFGIPKRFWVRLCEYAGIDTGLVFLDLSKKQMNKLTEELAQGLYEVKGKSTFKDEFVTAGGVELKEINLDTFECRRFPQLYLAGEVLNIDALTGGFNFQACWSGGWIIANNI